MRNVGRIFLGLGLVFLLVGAMGANPRFLEELRIGGGPSDAVDGGTDLDGQGNITASATIQAEQLTSTDDASIADDVSVGGDATVAGTVSAEQITSTDDATIADDASVGGTLTVTETVTAEQLTSTDDATVTGTITAGDYEGETAATDNDGLMSQEDKAKLDGIEAGSTDTEFSLDGDTGTPETVGDGDTLTIAGSTYIDTAVGTTDTVTVSLDLTAGLTIPDDQYLKVGTGTDIYYGYDETTDDRAEWTDGTNLLMYLADAGTTGNGGVTGNWLANTIAVHSGSTATLYNTSATTVNAFGAATTLNIGNASGANTILGTSNFTRLNTTGGVHVGGTSDPGTDNLIVDGTSTLTGNLTTSGTSNSIGSSADLAATLMNGRFQFYNYSSTAESLRGNGTVTAFENYRTISSGTVNIRFDFRGASGTTNTDIQFFRLTPSLSGTQRIVVLSPNTSTENFTIDAKTGNTTAKGTLTLGSGANVVSTSAGLIDDTKIDPGTNGQLLVTSSGASAWGTPKTKAVILTAKGITPALTTPCAEPAQAATATNAVNYWGAAFDQTSDEYGWFEFPVPADYRTGTDITFRVYWASASSSTNNVVWNVAIYQRGDAQAIDAAATTSASVTDANNGADTQNVTNSTTITGSSLTNTTMWRVRVSRDADNGSDDLAADANLEMVKLEYQPDAF